MIDSIFRQMRQIEDITSTQDGAHLLILLTDGGVLYFRAAREETDTESAEDSAGQSTFMPASLTEFSKLSYTQGVDSAWCLRRVGASGAVILIRASKSDIESSTTSLFIAPLSGMLAC